MSSSVAILSEKNECRKMTNDRYEGQNSYHRIEFFRRNRFTRNLRAWCFSEGKNNRRIDVIVRYVVVIFEDNPHVNVTTDPRCKPFHSSKTACHPPIVTEYTLRRTTRHYERILLTSSWILLRLFHRLYNAKRRILGALISRSSSS